jgi:hypothetical protein
MEKQQRELYEWELFGSEEIYHHLTDKLWERFVFCTRQNRSKYNL